mmetsp:Transcript_27440/g.43556  ORF Transcript_27440/g.43556 Transcript_27440/m.43556 type:complete len:386 (-) Transcript_27440:169-1326(-)|eukprot:180040-Amorphochlora_amoeboformis.AAC.1
MSLTYVSAGFSYHGGRYNGNPETFVDYMEQLDAFLLSRDWHSVANGTFGGRPYQYRHDHHPSDTDFKWTVKGLVCIFSRSEVAEQIKGGTRARLVKPEGSKSEADSKEDGITGAWLHHLQTAFNQISRRLYFAIAQTITSDLNRRLTNFGVSQGDGPGAYKGLRRVIVGDTQTDIMSVFRQLLRLKQCEQYTKLERYIHRFKYLAGVLCDAGPEYKIPPPLLSTLFLDSLDKKYEPIRVNIWDDRVGAKTLTVDTCIHRIRTYHKNKGFDSEIIHISGLGANGGQDGSDEGGSDEEGANGRKTGGPKCFNCGLRHPGLERQCKAPCKICKSKKHVRFTCPKRKKGNNNHKIHRSPNPPPTVMAAAEEIQWGCGAVHITSGGSYHL